MELSRQKKEESNRVYLLPSNPGRVPAFYLKKRV
jgi:hypothetical protein